MWSLFINGHLFSISTSYSNFVLLKGRVHCISMQIVMNKCFFLNPEKRRRPVLSFSIKTQIMHTLIPKNDVTEPKARLLQQPVNRLKDSFKLSKTIVSGNLKLTINLLTVQLVIRVA